MAERMYNPIKDIPEVIRSKRNVPPSDYIFEIHSFNFFSQILDRFDEDKFETRIFEADGYKWRLLFYPNGDEERNGEGHISLYLKLVDTLAQGIEVNVEYKLFLHDQIRDQYLVVQDEVGKASRYHLLKTENGFSQFLPLSIFRDASNGYLVNDYCCFGVEIHVLNKKANGEKLLDVLEPHPQDFTWCVPLAKLSNEGKHSQYFTAGGRRWRLELATEESTDAVSLYLHMEMKRNSRDKLGNWPQVYGECELKIQNHDSNLDVTEYVCEWFNGDSNGEGYKKFMALSDASDASKGYLDQDGSLTVAARFEGMFAVEELTKQVSFRDRIFSQRTDNILAVVIKFTYFVLLPFPILLLSCKLFFHFFLVF